MPQLIFGGIIALILLVFYAWAIISGACAVGHSSFQCKSVVSFSEPVQYALNIIGGLISATVVAVLGATQHGEFPALRIFKKDFAGTVQTFAGYMPSFYILTWIVFGTFMFTFGFFLYPDNADPAPAFAAHAKAWLGTAIAAVYAYFGITPDPKNVNNAGNAGGGNADGGGGNH